MNIVINSPTKAYINNATPEELNVLKKQLSYKNSSVQYLISKHRKNRWWRNRDEDGWEFRLQELTDQLHSCLLNNDGNSYWVRPGFIPYIKRLEFSVENNIKYPKLQSLSWKSNPEFDPYKYQSEAVEKLLKSKHGSISLPTGCGKSFILLMLAKEMGLKIVIVTPGKSIFNELLVEFQKRLGNSVVGGYGDGKKDIKKPITIAIGKSLTMLKEGSEAHKFFQKKEVMMVDESHTFAASQLEDVCHGVLEHVPYRFFVSATQTRGDGTEKMLHSIIGETVMEMSLEDAINQKYLCPLKFSIVEVISPSTLVKKDPLECKRTHFLYNKEIAKLYANIANASWTHKKESTLILVEELRQIKMIIDLLKVPYAYVHSGSKKDAEEWGLETVKLQDQVDRFNNGEAIVLIGTRAISTGTNMYPTHNTCNWVGGSSEIYTKQGTMGRSTRKLEISKYKNFHKEKLFTNIYDVRVKGQPVLEKQLEKRVVFYEESGGEIKYF